MAVTANLNRASLARRSHQWIACALIGLFAFLASGFGAGESMPSKEFQVKAVFLYHFVQFVEWPPHAFESPSSPIVIGLLGADPFGPFLDELVKGETVGGRRIVVERYRWVGEVDQCHVLFVSGSEGGRARQIAEELRQRAILTVCDWEGLEREGAMVRFVTERNRVRLRINLTSAKEAGLTISSKLLRSADAVTASN